MPPVNPRSWQFLFALLVTAILVLALIPPAGAPTTGWDKSNHLLAFATLALAGAQAWPGKRKALAAGLLVYGAWIEGLQALTPYRSADWIDVLADGVGVALGLSLHWTGATVLAAARARWRR